MHAVEVIEVHAALQIGQGQQLGGSRAEVVGRVVLGGGEDEFVFGAVVAGVKATGADRSTCPLKSSSARRIPSDRAVTDGICLLLQRARRRALCQPLAATKAFTMA